MWGPRGGAGAFFTAEDLSVGAAFRRPGRATPPITCGGEGAGDGAVFVSAVCAPPRNGGQLGRVNTLYGVALGISGNGTVFALNTNGTGFTILHSFPATNFTVPSDGPTPPPGYANNDGVGPTGLILSGSTLYGTAVWGGTNGNGTVFAINTNGTGFATLHSFAATAGANYTDSEGAHPIAFSGLVLSGNTLYGTALFGGSAGNGTVFSLNTNGTWFYDPL